ncbi:hypothetical protein KUH03_05970 [Sphingobacterium sp. E70]|uniref:hypothetical protein n=1 Tax=Sphingobacterium sp. E70 TaxID=2853439 RepID=UPI00211C8175|nr:hypothetical protein [Sphingobacterium sp. E70]ULT26440.1 hypothetical protein KUH03_05970 [Sphingobacterium sp. E70]
MLPYELSTPLFSDYMVKDRFIVLPRGKSIEYTAQGPLDFPDSTIIVKNFSYINVQGQKVVIETRLLVKDPIDHNWKVMNYLWNTEQTDAVKHIRGSKLAITLVDNSGNKHTTNYMVPNTNDCKRCHNNASKLMPIGPKARNLNFVRTGDSVNQLTRWSSLGLLKNMPDLKNISQLPVWTDRENTVLKNVPELIWTSIVHTVIRKVVTHLIQGYFSIMKRTNRHIWVWIKHLYLPEEGQVA